MSANPSGETLHGLPLFRRGKVRDTWVVGDDLLMVASDRLSAFDVILPTAIPDKGVVLTQLSRFWFDRIGDIVPNHLITTDLPSVSDRLPNGIVADPGLAGRTMLVRRADRIDVECVVRGHLYGSVWSEYQREGSVAGVALPAGLRLADRLPEPLFSPALKVDDGHDVNVAVAAVADQFGADVAGELERISLELYARASAYAGERGLILADTKFEFGYIDGRINLIDEVLTPDSSRYWDASRYRPGSDQPSFDKQFVREWLASSGWDREPPAPELPSAIVAGTQQRYREAYRALTGTDLAEPRV